MKREDFVAIKFVLPDAKFKADQKTKSTLLVDATKAFEHVIQYQSERMFESAYWIGRCMRTLPKPGKTRSVRSWDPIKMAVLEKDVALMSSTLLQKSFIPYKKAIELSAGFDSLNSGQKTWCTKQRSVFARTICRRGESLMVDAYAAMQNAPVPQKSGTSPCIFTSTRNSFLKR